MENNYKEMMKVPRMCVERVEYLLGITDERLNYIEDYSMQLELLRSLRVMSYEELSYLVNIFSEVRDDSFSLVFDDIISSMKENIDTFSQAFDSGRGYEYLSDWDEFEKAQLLILLGIDRLDLELDEREKKMQELILSDMSLGLDEDGDLEVIAVVWIWKEYKENYDDERFINNLFYEIARRRNYEDPYEMVECDTAKSKFRRLGFSKERIKKEASVIGFESLDDLYHSGFRLNFSNENLNDGSNLSDDENGIGIDDLVGLSFHKYSKNKFAKVKLKNIATGGFDIGKLTDC